MFLFVVALGESISVPLRTQPTFPLFSLGTNAIVMPLQFFILAASDNNFLI